MRRVVIEALLCRGTDALANLCQLFAQLRGHNKAVAKLTDGVAGAHQGVHAQVKVGVIAVGNAFVYILAVCLAVLHQVVLVPAAAPLAFCDMGRIQLDFGSLAHFHLTGLGTPLAVGKIGKGIHLVAMLQRMGAHPASSLQAILRSCFRHSSASGFTRLLHRFFF